MKKLTFIASLFLLASGFANAQKIQLADLTVAIGPMSNSESNMNIADARQLYPDSKILSGNLSDFDYYTSYSNFSPASALTSLSTHWLLKASSDRKLQSFVGFGLQYGGYYEKTFSFHAQTRTQLETLQTRPGMSSINIDSIHSKNVWGGIGAHMFGLSAGKYWQTNTHTRWNFSFGMQLSYFIYQVTESSVGYREAYNYSASGSFNDYGGVNRGGTSYPIDEQTEYFKRENVNAWAVMAPLDISFDLSKKHEFFKRVALLYQFSIGCTGVKFPKLDREFQLRIANQFGLRFKLG
ncbi:hypothetical protein GC194_03975 [bacterium]|nr:hypothetical protein [bacterium]